MENKLNNTEKVFLRPLFDFRYSTMMMFKCTKKRFANDLKNGKLYFGTPENWVKEEQKGNKGQGDILEGTFFTTSLDDKEDLVLKLKKDKDIDCFDYNGRVYFRDKNILKLRCCCFYGLNDNMFKKEIDETGVAHYKFTVPRSYFRDFSDCETWEEYEKIQDDEKPSVVFIKDPREFFKRVKEAIVKLNVSEKDIIISPVDYIDKNQKTVSMLPFPMDLLVKDKSFKNQSEIRVVINSISQDYQQYMLKNNNIIDIGDVSDIVEIYDYYFQDMKIERRGNKSAMFTLPKSKEQSIYTFGFFELYDLLSNILCGTVKIIGISDRATWQEKLKIITDLFYKKYGVIVYVDENKRINMYNLSDDLIKKMDEYNHIPIERNKFEKIIIDMMRNNNNTDALKLCDNKREDKILKGAAYYYMGRIYKNMGKKEEAIETFNKAYLQDYKPVESLDGIASVYFGNREYDKAIEMYEQIQDVKGYDPMIYANMSVCYMNGNNYSKAIECLNKAEAIDNSKAYIYYNRGFAYYKIKEYENAEKDMHRATILAPNNEHYISEYNRLFKK